MTQKIVINVKVPEELRDKAHQLNINMSGVCRSALERAVSQGAKCE